MGADQAAIRQFVELVSQQGADRIAKFQAETLEVWSMIGKAVPGIDLETIMWVPSETEDKIIPVQAKISPFDNNGDKR